MNYARDCIAKIDGYVPGEQPQGRTYVKLNTNENPYPPSPKVGEALKNFDWKRLRLYSEPSALMIRQAAAEWFGLKPENIICGNGSDDLLTIALRTFVDQGGKLAFTEPSYSLYPVLADIQGANHAPVALTDDFQLPDDAVEQAGDATLFILANPNAPTGTLLSKAKLCEIAEKFHGVLWIDEAYADFSGQTCMDMVKKYPNVVVSRTMSKSFSLAGLRLGIAAADESLIFEMFKVKDSYNVDMITQYLATAALRDVEYMQANAKRIIATREKTAAALKKLGCVVEPSSSNFLFVKPPKDAETVFKQLKDNGFLVRYFKLPRVSDYIRITMGTEEDMDAFVQTFAKIVQG